MTRYEAAFQRAAPDLNPTHLETLALRMHRTLCHLDAAGFREIADTGRRMGAGALAHLHHAETAHNLD